MWFIQLISRGMIHHVWLRSLTPFIKGTLIKTLWLTWHWNILPHSFHRIRTICQDYFFWPSVHSCCGSKRRPCSSFVAQDRATRREAGGEEEADPTRWRCCQLPPLPLPGCRRHRCYRSPRPRLDTASVPQHRTYYILHLPRHYPRYVNANWFIWIYQWWPCQSEM